MDHLNATIQKSFCLFFVADVADQRNEKGADHAAAIVNVLQDHHVVDHRDVVHDHLRRKSICNCFFVCATTEINFLFQFFFTDIVHHHHVHSVGAELHQMDWEIVRHQKI